MTNCFDRCASKVVNELGVQVRALDVQGTCKRVEMFLSEKYLHSCLSVNYLFIIPKCRIY